MNSLDLGKTQPARDLSCADQIASSDEAILIWQ